MTDRDFVTVEGFTFRHVLDSGIFLSPGCSNVIALNNTSYGNRQGIRVDRSTNVLIVGNTLFRNENSGVYFLRESVDGWAIGNTLYENVKGLRWGSDSNGALAVGNLVYENSEAGISLEHASGARLLRNQVVNNGKTQLYALYSNFHSEGNCFDRGLRGELIADLYIHKFKTLRDYRRVAGQDLASREGDCGPLPRKLDVRKLHQESMSYAEKARKSRAEGQAGKGDR
jgi:parallel beta-helix repeat protein